MWAVRWQAIRGETSYQPLIEHWDGQTWISIENPAPPQYSGLLLSVSADTKTDAWAVGYGSTSDYTTWVEHWDGTTWTAS